jgi:hypothetical protein
MFKLFYKGSVFQRADVQIYENERYCLKKRNDKEALLRIYVCEMLTTDITFSVFPCGSTCALPCSLNC